MWKWKRFDKTVKIVSYLLLVTTSSSAKVKSFTAILKPWILVFKIFWVGCMMVKSCLPLCCSTVWCFGQQRSEMRQAERESEPWSPASNSTFLTPRLLHKMKVLLPRVQYPSPVLRFIPFNKSVSSSIMNPTLTVCSGARKHQNFIYNLVLCRNMKNCFLRLLMFLLNFSPKI